MPPSITSSSTFQELLDISEQDPNALSYWINAHLNQSATLDGLLSGIGQNPKYFHFYIEYSVQALRKWNMLPSKLIPTLEYLFRNISQLARENTNILDAIDGYGFETLFANPLVLSSISKIPVSECDPEGLIRFVRYYMRNYDRNILLREYKGFIQRGIECLVTSHPKELHDIFTYGSEKLLEEVGFPLSKGYALFFEITKTEGRPYASDREIAYIRRLSEETVLSEMIAMDMKTFCGFVDRFRYRATEGRIHFLGFQGITTISPEKCFYLSLVYKTRLFSEPETKNFLAYCVIQMALGSGRIYGENIFSNISVILDFISSENIIVFENETLFLIIIAALSKNEHYIYTFENYLKKLERKSIPDAQFAKNIFKSTKSLPKKITDILFSFFSLQLLGFFAAEEYLDFSKRAKGEIMPGWRNDILNSALASVPRLARSSYLLQEQYLRHMLTASLFSSYEKKEIIKQYVSGNSRMRYVLMRNKRLWMGTLVSYYEVGDIRERCFSVTVFPLGLRHSIPYWVSRMLSN